LNDAFQVTKSDLKLFKNFFPALNEHRIDPNNTRKKYLISLLGEISKIILTNHTNVGTINTTICEMIVEQLLDRGFYNLMYKRSIYVFSPIFFRLAPENLIIESYEEAIECIDILNVLIYLFNTRKYKTERQFLQLI
jgi:hypothetical protein